MILNEVRGWAKATLPTYQDRKLFFESIVNGDPDPIELLRRGDHEGVSALIDGHRERTLNQLSKGLGALLLGLMILLVAAVVAIFGAARRAGLSSPASECRKSSSIPLVRKAVPAARMPLDRGQSSEVPGAAPKSGTPRTARVWNHHAWRAVVPDVHLYAALSA